MTLDDFYREHELVASQLSYFTGATRTSARAWCRRGYDVTGIYPGDAFGAVWYAACERFVDGAIEYELAVYRDGTWHWD